MKKGVTVTDSTKAPADSNDGSQDAAGVVDSTAEVVEVPQGAAYPEIRSKVPKNKGKTTAIMMLGAGLLAPFIWAFAPCVAMRSGRYAKWISWVSFTLFWIFVLVLFIIWNHYAKDVTDP